MLARILHITTIHPVQDTRIFKKECLSLQKAGYAVSLLAGNANSEVIDGIQVIGIPYATSRLKRFTAGPKAFYRYCMEHEYDVYHFHDPEFLPYGKRLAAQGKCVIYDAHEDVPRQILAKYYLPKWLRPILSRRFERMENGCIPHFAAVVTATEHIANRFRPLNDRSIAIHNFPSLEEMGDLPDTMHKSERTLCYIGSITAIRGAREMLRLMEHVDGELLLGGPFSPSELQMELEQMPGWKKTRYLGVLSRQQVVETLNEARLGLVLLHPTINYRDAFPVKMFEYMAKGIPVVVTDVPLWRSIVEDCGCGIAVGLDDMHQMANRVNDLLADAGKLNTMAANGRKAVETRYNWAPEEQKLLDLYATLI
ncbi:MAG: glycosyltransferase family 4 protein [Flavobacteriales bacterium]|nr:glycosyltransferase family 4 protein [Flavobacteriales bacterium]